MEDAHEEFAVAHADAVRIEVAHEPLVGIVDPAALHQEFDQREMGAGQHLAEVGALQAMVVGRGGEDGIGILEGAQQLGQGLAAVAKVLALHLVQALAQGLLVAHVHTRLQLALEGFGFAGVLGGEVLYYKGSAAQQRVHVALVDLQQLEVAGEQRLIGEDGYEALRVALLYGRIAEQHRLVMAGLVHQVPQYAGIVDEQRQLVEEFLVGLDAHALQALPEEGQRVAGIDIGNHRDDVIEEFCPVMGVVEHAVAYQVEEAQPRPGAIAAGIGEVLQLAQVLEHREVAEGVDVIEYDRIVNRGVQQVHEVAHIALQGRSLLAVGELYLAGVDVQALRQAPQGIGAPYAVYGEHDAAEPGSCSQGHEPGGRARAGDQGEHPAQEDAEGYEGGCREGIGEVGGPGSLHGFPEAGLGGPAQVHLPHDLVYQRLFHGIGRGSLFLAGEIREGYLQPVMLGVGCCPRVHHGALARAGGAADGYVRQRRVVEHQRELAVVGCKLVFLQQSGGEGQQGGVRLCGVPCVVHSSPPLRLIVENSNCI